MKNEFEKMQDRAAKKALKYQQMKDYVWSGNQVSKDVYAGMTKEERGQYDLLKQTYGLGKVCEKQHPIIAMIIATLCVFPIIGYIIIAAILMAILQ